MTGLRKIIGLTCIMATLSAFATPSDSERLKTVDILYRMFDSPLGVRDIAYKTDYLTLSDMIDDLNEDGYTPGNGFTYELIRMEEPEPDPNLQEAIRVKLPKDYKIPGSELKPVSVEFYRFNDSLRVEYLLPTGPDELTYMMRSAKYAPESDDFATCAYRGFGRHRYVAQSDSNNTGMTRFYATMPIPAEDWHNIPATYSDTRSYLDLPSDAPCNQGDEPFSTFLKKFNSSKEFRENRISDSPIALYEIRKKGLLTFNYRFHEMVLNAMEKCKLYPVKGHAHVGPNPDTGVTYDDIGYWCAPTADKIIYSGWNLRVPGLDEFDSNAVILMFERLDGKWQLTNTYYFGEKIDNEVRRQIEEMMNEQ